MIDRCFNSMFLVDFGLLQHVLGISCAFAGATPDCVDHLQHRSRSVVDAVECNRVVVASAKLSVCCSRFTMMFNAQTYPVLYRTQ